MSQVPSNQQNMLQGQVQGQPQIQSQPQSLPQQMQQGSQPPQSQNDEKKDDSPPKIEATLKLSGTPEFDQFPFNQTKNKFLFVASVKASYFRPKDRAAVDLCCVVDESSSMGGERMKLVKETLTFIVKLLEKTDRFGIIGYHSQSRQVLALINMTEDGKKEALQKITNLRPQGRTALCDGLVDGVKMMKNRDPSKCNPVSSIMLLTDGEANQGPTEARDICKAMRNVDSSSNVTSNGQSPQMQRTQSAQPNAHQMQQQMLPQIQQQSQSMQQTQQQITQQMQRQPSNNNNNDNNENDKKENSSEKEGQLANDNGLPCTVNTFGFGVDHNGSLLQSIADDGRGMYTFIENTEMIAESFAECLGGLVSIVAKNIEIKLLPMNGVTIGKCLSSAAYKVSSHETEQFIKYYKVKINDIQSEENRDLLFEINLPQLNEIREQWPMMQVSCTYSNVVKKKNEILSLIVELDRKDMIETGERNENVDLQYNRILAAEAMETADKLAEQGDLKAANKMLDVASNTIKQSLTAQKEFTQNLVSDMQRCQSNLSSHHQYQTYGSKMLKSNKSAQYQQRSTTSTTWASQRAYSNSSKMYYKSAFK